MSLRTSLSHSCSLGIYFQWQDTCLPFCIERGTSTETASSIFRREVSNVARMQGNRISLHARLLLRRQAIGRYVVSNAWPEDLHLSA